MYNKVKDLPANEIREYLFREKGDEYHDKASLFTAFAYISEKPDDSDKDAFRKNAYLAYISGERGKLKTAWECIDCLEGSRQNVELKIRILKGGSYKIKDYYLENNDINDIRGASILLTHIEQNVIPGMIEQTFVPECIVYNGGGNIFAILPEDTDTDFAKKLEEKADELLVTASIAYCMSEPINAADILGKNYRSKMAAIENELDERKKLKIYNTIEIQSFLVPNDFEISFNDSESLKIEFGDVRPCETKSERKEFCDACGKRFAEFVLNDVPLCRGCLSKRKVGKAAKDGIYIKEFLEETKASDSAFKLNRISSAKDISGDKIAVVYADGNNMGGIIQHFGKITQMMEFSRRVKKITRKGVYNALYEQKAESFEIVALGGDDVFVILPSEKAFDFSVSFAKKYKEYFSSYLKDGEIEDISTMSVGIAAAKYVTPIKILLESAEDMLDKAKIYERERSLSNRDGSVAFKVLDSYCDSEDYYDPDKKIAERTLQPYSIKTAGEISQFIKRNSSDKTSGSRIRNILDAFVNADSLKEAKLFYNYVIAKEGDKEREKVKKQMQLPDIDGYTQSDGFYISKDGRHSYIWGDILDLEKLFGDSLEEQ